MTRATRLTALVGAGLCAVAGWPAVSASHADTPQHDTTAWHAGAFHVDVPGVVGRSDVVLQRPNTDQKQSMPLGNGTLGAAVWSADGFTAQLNRADTMPDRLSPGQLVIPGLAALTSAPDYTARLDLYNGTFVESGGGMTATAYVQSGTDELVVDVRGADPKTPQTATLKLWEPRTPQTYAAGRVGALSQSWVDEGRPGSDGARYGSLAAVTAGGRDVRASVSGDRSVTVSFKPNAGGSYRVVVAAPHWAGGDAATTARSSLAGQAESARLLAQHESWWHHFWGHVGLMRLSSSDGSAEYFENIRTIGLYANAAERGDARPGSQAGVADLFDSTEDTHTWDPAAYWGWNLRMLTTANLGAGAYESNTGYFELYRRDLPAIEKWTASQFPGSSGACVPETMRFNGAGYQTHNDGAGFGVRPFLDCSGQGPANYNARTLTTGGEVSLFAWEQYQQTDDRAFLRRMYPIMSAWARFMLGYAKVGSDGKLHTSPSNAHETQWDVTDPTTDIAAMRAVFPIVAQAARTLHRDDKLASRLDDAVAALMPLPRTDAATQTQQLPPSADAAGDDVIGMSWDQAADTHNVENLGLEPVWPFGLIGDEGSDSALAKRTFEHRPYVGANDWSFDPIDAARLGLADDLVTTLTSQTERFQDRPSGLASFGETVRQPEPYIEQSGVVATALQDALVQDYDGTLRIAPAWPKDWSGDGTVYVQHRGKVDVQIRDGRLVTVAVEAGASTPMTVRNPWPGQRVTVVSGTNGRTVVAPTTAATFTLPARQGQSYLIRPAGSSGDLPFAPVTGTPATTPKTLGPVSIGLPAD